MSGLISELELAEQGVDLSVESSVILAVRKEMRRVYVVEYRGHKEQAELLLTAGDEPSARPHLNAAIVALKVILAIDDRIRRDQPQAAEVVVTGSEEAA